MKNNKNGEYELTLKELFKVLGNYKTLIILMMSIFFLLSNAYLFFKPSVYSTHGMIEVNTNDKNSKLTEDILQKAFYSTNKELGKEIELLKTFEVNRDVIKSMNMQTQVFISEKTPFFFDLYKKHEVYGKKNPLQFSKIKIINKKIIGKMIQIVPQKSGFSLKIEKKLLSFKKEELSFTDEIFSYGKMIKTDYFECIIKKSRDVNNSSIDFILNGDSHAIFEKIVTKQLDVMGVKKDTPLIKIIYEDTIPIRASKYINRLIKNFLKNGSDAKSEQNTKKLTFIKKELKKTKEKLKISERNLKNYRIDNKMTNSSVQSSEIIKKLSNIEIEISQNDLKHKLIGMIDKNNDISNIEPILLELNNKETIKLLTSLHNLKLKKKELSAEYTEEFPGIITINRQISSIRDKILSLIKKIALTIDEKSKNLRKLKEKYEKSLSQFPTKEIQLINLKQEYDANLKMHTYLLNKEKENEMIKAAIISDYKSVEEAHEPDKPIKPKKTLIKLFSIILGFIVGAILALIHNNSIDKIGSIFDIENFSSLVVNGTIPFAKKHKKRRIGVFQDSKSAFANSFRKLRIDLKFIYNATLPKTIVVTSDMNGDGKSVVVANLGAVLQLAGYRCIIVDLDLENPVMHQYFETNYGRGVNDYLTGKEKNLEKTVFSTLYPNLDIIPASTLISDLNSSELIFSEKIDIMFNQLKDNYDYILVDSAPVGLTSDTINLMKNADINLVVFSVNKTKKIAINNLEKLIEKYNIDNVGLILNRMSLKKNSYV